MKPFQCLLFGLFYIPLFNNISHMDAAPKSYICNYSSVVQSDAVYYVDLKYNSFYDTNHIEIILTKNGSYAASAYHYPGAMLYYSTRDVGPATVYYEVNVTEYYYTQWGDSWVDDWFNDSFTVTVQGGNTAPLLNIDTPSIETRRGEQVVISGWAVDNEQGAPVSKVQVLIDGYGYQQNATLGGDRPDVANHFGRQDYRYSGWQHVIDVNNYLGYMRGDSVYFTVVAYDNEGLYSNLGTVRMVIANTPPSVAMSAKGQSVGGGSYCAIPAITGEVLTFNVVASDIDGNYQRTRCWVSKNGTTWQEIYNSTATSGMFTYTVTSDDPHYFHCRALDGAGAESETAIINRNRPPIANTPSGPSRVYHNTTHAYAFNGSDPDGDLVAQETYAAEPGAPFGVNDNYWPNRQDFSAFGNSVSSSRMITFSKVGRWELHHRLGDSSGWYAWNAASNWSQILPVDVVVPARNANLEWWGSHASGELDFSQRFGGNDGGKYFVPGNTINLRGFCMDDDGIRDVEWIKIRIIDPTGQLISEMTSNGGDSLNVNGDGWSLMDRTYTFPNGIFGTYSVLVTTRMSQGETTSSMTFNMIDPTKDSDGDGLPDLWELLHGLDPNNPNDALLDSNGNGVANIAEYNRGTTPGMETPSASSYDNTIPKQWNALVAAGPNTSKTVGATNGNLSVDKNGAASYTIPIFTVPGTNGMQPEISLAYNSQSAGGIAGYGWSLTGLSAITRGGKTFKHDGIVRGMDYSLEDQYYLDGQRLVHAGGSPHGTSGAEYRLEHENFTRIIAQGAAGQGPESFKVWTKAGRVLEYGGTYDSRLYANSANHMLEVQTWAANRVTDASGNFMTFTYDNIAATGEQYLTRIDYTGNASAGLSPYAALEFEYDPDPDSTMGYVHGSKFSRNKRLKTITSRYGNTAVRSYSLGYNIQDINMPPRSLLLQITEADADGNSLPPLAFTYANPTDGWVTLNATQWAPPDCLADGVFWTFKNNYEQIRALHYIDKYNSFVDLNGDGYPDFVGTSKWDPTTQTTTYGWWHNKANGWEKSIYTTNKFLPTLAGSGCFADINGDGLIDVVLRTGEVFLNDGETFVPSDEWSIYNWPSFPSPTEAIDYTWGPVRCQIIDLNGDGRLDIMFDVQKDWKEKNPKYDPLAPDDPEHLGFRTITKIAFINSGKTTLANPGDAWKYSLEYSPGYVTDDMAYAGVYYMLDVNGDGLPDMVADRVDMSLDKYTETATHWWHYSHTRLNTGTGWGPKIASNYSSIFPKPTNPSVYHVPETLGLVFNSASYSQPSELLDLNGDGMVDIIRRNSIWSLAAPMAAHTAWMNTGDGWTSAPAGFLSPYELIPIYESAEMNGIAFVDINNDGRLDCTRSLDDERGTRLNMGNGWGSDNASYYLPAPYTYTRSSNMAGIILKERISGATDFIDLNADGAVDQVWHLRESEGGIPWQGPTSFSTISKGAALNKRVHPDRLTAVTNGAGITSAITYAPLTERDANGNPTVYQKDFTPADPLDPDPVKNVIGPIYVVKNITHSAPTTDAANTYGNYAIEYRYGHLRSHRLHGSLGFEWMNVTDTRTGITTTTRYSQEYPTIGKIIQNTTVTAGGTTISDIATLHGIKSLNNGLNRFTFAAEIESRSWALDGTLLSHTVTITDRTGDGSDYDGYGNPLRTETISGNGADTITSVTTRTYSNTTANDAWLLGRCLTAETTTTQDPVSLTHKNSRTYYPTTGQLHTETIEPGNAALSLTTTHTYDPCGDLESTTVEGSGITSRTTSVEYDTATRRFPVATTNALDHTTTTSCNGILNQALGLPSSATDPNNLTTSWTYDGFGRVLTETRPDGTTTTTDYRWATPNPALPGAHTLVVTQSTGAAPVATFADRWGRPIHALALAPGGITADARIVTTRTEYDNRGCVLRTWRPAWFGDTPVLDIETTYDILDRPVVISRADEDIIGGRVHIYTDYTGNAVETTDPLGRVERVETDLHARTIRRLNNAAAPAGSPERGEVTYTHDPLGRLTATHVHRENGAAITTTLGYDLLGRRTSMNDPDVGSWSYAYNVLGEVTSQTDAKNQTITFARDKLGRMTSRADADGSTTWAYDTAASGKGKLHTITHTEIGALPLTETHAYDTLSRPVTHTRAIAASTYITRTEYDTLGRPLLTEYPGGFRVKNVYTALGFLKEVREAGGRLNATHNYEVPANCLFWQAERFTPAGSVESATLGNGLTYDRVISTITGRVKAIQSTSMRAAPIQEQYYLYDALGQVTRRDDDATGLTEHYTYDALNRLTAWSATGSLPVSVTYDAIGNILHKSDTGSYAYSTAHPHAILQITGGPLGTRDYTHDANGNTLSDTRRAYQWTAANKVRRITQGAQTSQFTFDADRQRATQYREDGTLTTYAGPHYERVCHPGGLVEEKHYIMTPFGRTAVRTVRNDRKIETRYFHQDALGSIQAVTDEYGRLETRLAYDPWGRQTTQHDNRATPAEGKTIRGYTDHEMLEDFDLVHMNGRIYDPVTGRFLSADRVVQDIGNSQAYNRYSYCANNPVNATDPTGNEWNFMDFLRSFLNMEFYDPKGYEPEPLSDEIINSLTGMVSLILKVAGVPTVESQQGKSLLNQGESQGGSVGIEAGNQQTAEGDLTPEQIADLKERFAKYIQFLNDPLSVTFDTKEEAHVAGALQAAVKGGASYTQSSWDWFMGGPRTLDKKSADTYHKHEYVWGIVEVEKGKYRPTGAITNRESKDVVAYDNPEIKQAWMNGTLRGIGHNHPLGGIMDGYMSGYGKGPYPDFGGDRRTAENFRVPIFMTDPWGNHRQGTGIYGSEKAMAADLQKDDFRSLIKASRMEK